ncbi:MAG: tRNA (adenosine(37)-N6)-threonylcarbamoyltransferase complex dimerization subunit type 1 TsaB [Candidatus Saccharibacteria bacterium]|nr:tRNA (adenosine(37)-N6)-threonylcarbamoyltransferase complex dimerization subunit type 1 TsaB [Candidatus Saccharibacteria bacterium]
MILAIDTSTPECRMSLLNDGVITEKNWQADRRLALELLEQLENFLNENDINFQDLTGLIVFRGPGSFTGLRIGVTVMNTLADSLDIPIVGEVGEGWRQSGIERLRAGNPDEIVLPEYGSPPHITKPTK